jgi:hypothetical protein
MKFLIIDTYYQGFLRAIYSRNPGLSGQSYEAQWRQLMDQGFGTADFYSANLRDQGHEAHEVVANCDALQRRWAREHAPILWAAYPVYRWMPRTKQWQLSVLKKQVEKFDPDIVYVQDVNWTEEPFLKAIKRRRRLVVGQTACALRENIDFSAYDLIVTSFPHYVEQFNRQGVKSEYLRFAFEPRLLKQLGQLPLTHQAVFVGSYSTQHSSGTDLLEEVVRRVPVAFWGYGAAGLPEASPIRRSFHGEAWGLEMYRILASSEIALNRHINLADRFANNMRLFEATGVGTLLVTDWKENLDQMFDIGKEVIAYRSAEECAELIRYYMTHDLERRAIAIAGQARTLRDHTYFQRMQELVEIMRQYV